MPLKRYRPSFFVPTTSASGSESPHLFRGENMWIRIGRDPENIFAEGYSGSASHGSSLTIGAGTINGTLAWTSGDTTVTGTTTAFLSEIDIGDFVFADGGAGETELFVVKKINSDTEFIACSAPTTTKSGKTGKNCPVIFPVGTDRGTCVSGNVIQFPQGHYLGVGRGSFAINGSVTLGSGGTLSLSKQPQFALYDAAADTYTQDDVGIDQLLTPITLAAVAARNATVTGATNATPIVITTGGNHHLHHGQKINITGVTGNTAANGDWTITLLTATTFSLNGSVGNAAYVAGGTVSSVTSQMRASAYSIRVCPKNTKTLGFANPTEAIAPVTLTAGQEIQITFNTAMLSDQDGYDIYASPFKDSTTTTIEPAHNGPWYLLSGTSTSSNASVVASDLIDATHATGREAGTTLYLSYTDGEIQTSKRILSFDNFTPKEALFVDMISGIVIYLSCLGKGNTAKLEGTAPGPVAIPSKPSNPEAVFLDKAMTTAQADYIIGELNINARIYALCQNSLQTLLLTTLDDAPVAFRSLWNTGFRNPYNACAVKNYIYAYSTQGMARSVAGGDDSAMEFEFASDIKDYVKTWDAGNVLVAYDPKNRAVCYFYAAFERRGGYWVTLVLPFMLDKQVWNPPIIISRSDRDMIVTGVATIGNELIFIAGGRKSNGTTTFESYIFDGGDPADAIDWYLAWAYTDDGADFDPKAITKFSTTGQYETGLTVQTYGFPVSGVVPITDLENGTNAYNTFPTTAASTALTAYEPKTVGTTGLTHYTVRVSGSYQNIPVVPDRFDELILEVEGDSAET